jgi:hypothetical protein
MKFSKATWHPVQNHTTDGQDRVLGVVLHIMEGTLEGSQAWFDNPEAQASSHFGTGKDGELRQWVDTKDRAWAQGAGNHDYISIENEGYAGDVLSSGQLEACAQVLAWAVKTYNIPYLLADNPGDRGLGWHGMGGALWGGHTGCPGEPIKAQRRAVISRAKAINNPPKPKPVYAPFPGPSFFKIGKKSPLITAMGKRLEAEGYKGYKKGPSPEFTRSDMAAYTWWQKKLGYTGPDADGIPGADSWNKLKVPMV